MLLCFSIIIRSWSCVYMEEYKATKKQLLSLVKNNYSNFD